MVAKSAFDRSMVRRRTLFRPLGLLALVALLFGALLTPMSTGRAAEPDPGEPWEAEIWIAKWLDRDGDAATDEDRAMAGPGLEFAIGVVGTPDPTQVTTDDEGMTSVILEVATDTAQIRITELAEDADLVDAYCVTEDGDVPQTIEGSALTFEVDRDAEDATWYCEFVNAGDFPSVIPVEVYSWADGDGDPATADWQFGTRWTYDVDVIGAATDVESLDTGPDGESAWFEIEMVEATATLRLTEDARDGWTLLEAFCESNEGETGTLSGRTLVVKLDRDVDGYVCQFISTREVTAPTEPPSASPSGAVGGVTATPAVTLPPTDGIANTSQTGTLSTTFVAVGLAGVVALALATIQRRKRIP